MKLGILKYFRYICIGLVAIATYSIKNINRYASGFLTSDRVVLVTSLEHSGFHLDTAGIVYNESETKLRIRQLEAISQINPALSNRSQQVADTERLQANTVLSSGHQLCQLFTLNKKVRFFISAKERGI